MKKISTIVIALMLALSGMHFSIASHYCQGSLSRTAISLNGKTADCGMEHSRSGSHETAFSRECCEDEVTMYTVDNDYSPSFLSYIQVPAVTTLLVAHISNLHAVTSKQRPENPPGYDLITSVETSEICILRL